MNADKDQPKDLSYCQRVALAVLRLKQQLQLEYEHTHPELREVIPLILAQEEKNAWNLSFFPHLLLPGLVDVRMAKLNAPRKDEAPARGAHDPLADYEISQNVRLGSQELEMSTIHKHETPNSISRRSSHARISH